MKIKEIFQKNRKNGLIFVKNRDFWKSRRNPFRRSFSAETFSAEISGDQCTLISRPTTLIWPECVHLRPRVQKTHEAIHQNERATKQFNAEKITRLDIRKSLNLSDIIIDTMKIVYSNKIWRQIWKENIKFYHRRKINVEHWTVWLYIKNHYLLIYELFINVKCLHWNGLFNI